MKTCYAFLLFSFSFSLSAQTLKDFKSCTSQECKITTSYSLAKQYLEEDKIETAQQWLNQTKDLHLKKEKDTIDCFINSLQAELYYYMGMFQFAKTEAEKGLVTSRKLQDSLLIADTSFFVGINEFELNNYKNAEKNLWLSRNYFPKNYSKNRMSYTIEKEHILNNLAQLKLKVNQTDSALYYNKKANQLSREKNSKRGIPNTEQTFGQIYLQQGKVDSSRYYFQKSLVSALKFSYYDIALVDCGLLMISNTDNLQKVEEYYQQGKTLMDQQIINSFFRKTFYEYALRAFQNKNQEKTTIEILNKIIEINAYSKQNTNSQIQEISTQYVKNENKLLSEEANKLRKQRNITLLLIFSAVLCICILVLSIMIIRRKNTEEKKQRVIRFESLMNGQEYERKRIAQELHDGLNGDLSAIKYRVSALEEVGANQSEKTHIQKTIEMIDQACAQVRRISHDLMPASIERFGLVESLNQLCQKLNVAKRIDIEFQTFGNYQKLSNAHETSLYRILQELLQNILNHSAATQALVVINFHQNEISISVEDNGQGFDLAKKQGGIGLKNIQSRVENLSGDLEIKSSENGTFIHILINLKNL